MKKTDNPEKPRCFYIPHDPLKYAYKGEIFNPTTGEFEIPVARTQQAHKDSCDINNIIKQFQRTGQIAHISANAAKGAYLDLPDPLDYQEAQNIMLEASASFSSLPSKVRERFSNNPAEFLEFMADKNNEKEARELGLLTPATPLPDTRPEPSPEPKNPAQK